MPAFQSIMLTGESRVYAAPEMAAYCADARRAGLTHVQVNFLPDPYHQVLIEQPDNYYAWFFDYGASLDQFVSSDVNRGLYLEAHLSRNRAYLRGMVGVVIEYGLKPVLMLCEPRFVPERFFALHPELRGARVDNPFFSDTPWYALCVQHPKVREHYRQMLSTLLREVPDLAGISIFTHDSGAGFCHSRSLYAGPNGCARCRKMEPGQRIAEFLGLLADMGRAIHPDFRVSLSSGVEGIERLSFLKHAPEGVTGEVQGAWSWVGGLEDQWAWHQHGRALEQIGYERAREERITEYCQRLTAVSDAGKIPVAICSMPTDGFYLPIRYVPHPFQNLDILRTLREMGVKHLNCKGTLNPSSLVRFEINRESFAAFQEAPDQSPEKIVYNLALKWVGPAHAENLVKAWRLIDESHRRRTMWLWPLARLISFMPGPIVPNPDGLPADEIAFADHLSLACIDRLEGRHCLDALRMDETNRAWIIAHTYREVLPRLEQATALLETEISRCDSSEAKACLSEQLRHVRHHHLWQRCAQNWCEAGCWIAPGAGQPAPQRTLADVIDDEIQVTSRLIDFYRDGVDDLYIAGPMEGLLYVRGPGFVDELKARIDVMQRHRNDTPVPIGGTGRKVGGV